jgi:hypothetical protein
MPRIIKSNPTPAVSPVPASNRTLPLVVVLSTLLFVSLCAAGYFYYQYQQSPRVADAKEIAELKETVGGFFMLPEGEEPTLATVTDREKLADQPFFERAENGDKVLIYSNSGRAILYRPSTKKIVDVTTVNVQQPSAGESAQAEVASNQGEPTVLGESVALEEAREVVATVALYNGSKKVGITNSIEQKIKGVFPRSTVAKKESARVDTYEQTVVVDMSGKFGEAAQQLATSLGGVVGPKPQEEVDSGTDLLVIVGNDQSE